MFKLLPISLRALFHLFSVSSPIPPHTILFQTQCVAAKGSFLSFLRPSASSCFKTLFLESSSDTEPFSQLVALSLNVISWKGPSPLPCLRQVTLIIYSYSMLFLFFTSTFTIFNFICSFTYLIPICYTRLWIRGGHHVCFVLHFLSSTQASARHIIGSQQITRG